MKISVRTLFTTLVLGVLSPGFIFAVNQKSIWVTPVNSKAGDQIQLNSSVHNTTDKLLIFNLVFRSPEKTIKVFENLSVDAFGVKMVSVDYMLPQVPEEITVEIKNTHTKDGAKYSGFDGIIGTLALWPNTSNRLIDFNKINIYLNDLYFKIENFRIEQAEKFTTLNQKNKKILGQRALEDAGNIFKSNKNTSPVSDNASVSQNLGYYLEYIYSSAGEALFNNKLIFYLIFSLIVLYLLKIVFSRLL